MKYSLFRRDFRRHVEIIALVNDSADDLPRIVDEVIFLVAIGDDDGITFHPVTRRVAPLREASFHFLLEYDPATSKRY